MLFGFSEENSTAKHQKQLQFSNRFQNKKPNDINSFENSFSILNELITYFKDETRKSKKKKFIKCHLLN